MPPNLPVSAVPTLHPNSEKTTIPTPTYSEAHKKHIQFRRNRKIAARDARDQKHNKFDDMTFLQNWEKNELADNSYVKPRSNKGDTEINMGIVRDKDNTLLALALKYDYEPSAQVFDDKDEMLQEIAETSEDLVRKSRQIEDYIEKSKLIYRGMLTFGTQLVEEVYLERWRMEKVLAGTVGSSAATWTEKLTKIYDGCYSRDWDLRKCYPGDINKFFMNGPLGQPYFFTVEYLDYDSTKAIYGEWDMWQYVPTQVVMTPEIQSGTTWSAGWALQPLSLNQCEITKYYDPIANEFSIEINGIDMLPIQEHAVKGKNGEDKTYISGFPLSAVSPSGAIPFGKFDNEPFHNFFYSKSVPSKTRIIADVEDMTVKLMILGMKQMRRPPTGNRSGKVFTGDLFLPGQMTNDLREGEIFSLLPNQPGISPAEFSFYEKLKEARDEVSTTRGFSGAGGDTSTATQAIQDKEQQMDKVALMLDGIMRGEQQLFWLRTYNIFTNWTKPIDKEIDVERKAVSDIYRTVNLEKEIDGRNKAQKTIKFSTKPVPGKTPEEQSQYIHQQEVDLGKTKNNEVRIVVMNPVILRSMKLSWYYTVTPVAKNNDSMGQMMFAKAIQDAINFFGPQSLNVAKLKRKYANKYNVDYDQFFLDEDTLAQQQQQMTSMQPNVSLPGGSPTVGAVAQNKRPQLTMN